MGSASSSATIVAGVSIEDHLRVFENNESRELFDSDSGKKKGNISVIQYTYEIFGKKMPIVEKEYPSDGYSGPNRKFGWNMKLNFYRWVEENGFDTDIIYCQHSHHSSWPVTHPQGILGLSWDQRASMGYGDNYRDSFVELGDYTALLERTNVLLAAVGCPVDAKLFVSSNLCC